MAREQWKDLGEEASREARRLGSLVLEVLGGLRTPVEAAIAAGVSTPRYYQLEVRAIQGLVQALEPLPKGRQRRPEQEIESLKAEVDRLKRDLLRQQSLLRMAQRAVGLQSAQAQRKELEKKDKATGKRNRKRRTAKVRAKKAVAKLREGEPSKPPKPPSKTIATPPPSAKTKSA